MILENNKLIERNKELEKQVANLKNYVDKDSVPIGYEECLAVQPYVFETTEDTHKQSPVQIIEKGKEKAEGDSDSNNKDDVFISSLCNRVKVNKRMKTSTKPALETKKKVIIKLIN